MSNKLYRIPDLNIMLCTDLNIGVLIFEGKTSVGTYAIVISESINSYSLRVERDNEVFFLFEKDCKSEIEARSLIQADYEKRMSSGLIEVKQ